MAKLGGFWSYVHADDEADSGRIADLARDLVRQYGMLTGEVIELFLDRDSLEWGSVWKSKVDGTLASVAFFIPVVTPRYFQSAECRRELRSFAKQAQSLGLSELVMPLLYVDFPGLHEEDPADELIVIVKQFQWEDWTEVRFAERESGDYRRRVVALAERLVSANAEAAKVEASAEIPDPDGADEDDAPGIIDRMAEMELALPDWTRTVEKVGQIIADLGADMEVATQEMEDADKRGKGFAGRLTVARRLAQKLTGPGDEVLSLSRDFARHMSAVDSGIRAIIELAPPVVAAEPERESEVREFFDTIWEVSKSVNGGLGSIEDFLVQMEPVERMSRDLRPVLKKFRQGLTVILEGRAIVDDWVRLVDQSQLTIGPPPGEGALI